MERSRRSLDRCDTIRGPAAGRFQVFDSANQKKGPLAQVRNKSIALHQIEIMIQLASGHSNPYPLRSIRTGQQPAPNLTLAP